MRILKLLAVLLAVLALAGCQSPASVAPANPLVGTAWLAWDINGSGPGGKTYATLVFNPGRISGSGGCNRFSGALAVKADAWQASDIATTRM
jgi:putative lipoprotein